MTKKMEYKSPLAKRPPAHRSQRILLILTLSMATMLTLRYWYSLGILATLWTVVSSSPAARHRCKAGDECWPSAQEWASFNSSVNGQLIRSYPAAAVCHANHYSEELCAIAKERWDDSFWRTSQPGAYAAIVWELGNDQCFINSTIDSPCGQGLVAQYSLNVSNIEDIQAGIRFAAERNLYLVIKNTGHDHLGRSSGDGSFAIWTHNLKGREWTKSFVPKNAPSTVAGMPAVTLQAGEQWLDVYREAALHNVTVVGGSARTVGAAGVSNTCWIFEAIANVCQGYLTGGGHSPFSHFYGLAVDNLLEANIVAPNGTGLTLNEYTDPEYFKALRGGSGSAWGVITSATYRTHPLPTHIQAVGIQANATSESGLRELYERILPLLPDITKAGYTGYATLDGQLGFIFLQANATNATYEETFAPLNELRDIEGVEILLTSPLVFPTWLDYGQYFLNDPNIATNIQDASRLLTPDVLKNKSKELVDLIFDFPELGPGFNFMGAVNPAKRKETSVHPVWGESVGVFSLGVDWPDHASAAEKRRLKKMLVEVSRRLEKIVGKGGGTYVNEANP